MPSLVGKIVVGLSLAAFAAGCGSSQQGNTASQPLTPVSVVPAEKVLPKVPAESAANSVTPVAVAAEANVALPQVVNPALPGPAVRLQSEELAPIPFTEQPRPANQPAAEKRSLELELTVPSKLDLSTRLVPEDKHVAPAKPYTADVPELSRRETVRLAVPQLPAGGKRWVAAPNPADAFLPPLSMPELERPTPASDPGQIYARTVTQPPSDIGRGGFAPSIPLLPSDPEENGRVFRLPPIPAEVDPPARGRVTVTLPMEAAPAKGS